MSDPIVKAEMLPLDGKHYGTGIRLHLSNGESTVLNVWIRGEGGPSDAACAEWGLTRAEWLANKEVDDGWGWTSPIQSMFPCDNHYQSQYELEICQQIVDSLNRGGTDE